MEAFLAKFCFWLLVGLADFVLEIFAFQVFVKSFICFHLVASKSLPHSGFRASSARMVTGMFRLPSAANSSTRSAVSASLTTSLLARIIDVGFICNVLSFAARCLVAPGGIFFYSSSQVNLPLPLSRHWPRPRSVP